MLKKHLWLLMLKTDVLLHILMIFFPLDFFNEYKIQKNSVYLK